MPERYPEEFRRKVLDPVAALSPRSPPIWASVTRPSTTGAKELIDTGELPGLDRAEQAELAAANTHPRARNRGGDPEMGP